MKKQLEIAIIKANSLLLEGCELYWLVSRKQLEFLIKELEISPSPPFAAAARYRETVLPVINLEQYYGVEQSARNGSVKYLVLRSVDEDKELIKLIVETPGTVKLHKLEEGFVAMQIPAMPINNEDILGSYSLGTGKVGIVPDFASMLRRLRLPENKEM